MRVHIISSDHQEFTVEKKSAEQSIYIENMICEQDESDVVTITLPNVTGKVLQKVIEWCNHHCDDITVNETERLGDDWDQAFLQQMEQDLLFEVIIAANYLDIKGLLNVACWEVKRKIKGMTANEIRTAFSITHKEQQQNNN